MKVEGMPVLITTPAMRGGTYRESGFRRSEWLKAA